MSKRPFARAWDAAPEGQKKWIAGAIVEAIHLLRDIWNSSNEDQGNQLKQRTLKFMNTVVATAPDAEE